MAEYDVVIIGAGAVGCALGKLLSEYEIKTAILEKEYDVAFGVSGRNSGVVHAGFNNAEGSLKARFCVEGSRNFEKLASELGVTYKKTGKLVTGFSDEDKALLEELKERGEKNGVEGLRILNREEIKKINPNVEGDYALWSPESAVFNPFEYTIALAERASLNGVDFFFDSEVTEIEKDGEGEFLISAGEKIKTKVLVNCAGLYSDKICEMAGIDRYEIVPCRGEYHILEKEYSAVIDLPVYPVPDEKKGVLGVHLTPTTSGNLMIGPSAEFLKEKDDYGNEEQIMAMLRKGAVELLPALEKAPVIRSFSGIRPKLRDKDLGDIRDFVIEESQGFIYLLGIESPGVTGSMPIANYVFEMIEKSLGKTLEKKENNADSLSDTDEYDRLTKMVCRCEKVDEGEILKAYDRIIRLGAKPTIKGIKNRTRAFMGNCQGCFCTIDTVELLRKHRGTDISEITYNGAGSNMFIGRLKQGD